MAKDNRTKFTMVQNKQGQTLRVRVGDSEFPVWSSASIGQVPLREWEIDGRKPFTEQRLITASLAWLLNGHPSVTGLATAGETRLLAQVIQAERDRVGISPEDAAATLGASRWTIFRRITLPHATPSILAGAVLCWARALGEFGATVTFAGNLQGRTQTMPLAIYTAFNGAGVSQGTAVALSLLLLVTAVAVLLLVRGWRPGVGR